MVTAAVWWVVVSSFVPFLHNRTRSVVVSSTPYVVYAMLLTAVGVSRVYILAHFPHQVIAGTITGLVLGVLLRYSVPERRPLKFFFKLSIGLLLGAMFLNFGMQQLGIDLSWPLALAKKWCSRPEWVRLDTAPFSSFARSSGALMGLGLAEYFKPAGWPMRWTQKTLCLAISSVCLYQVDHLPLPTRPPTLFYTLYFAKFVLVPLIVMVFVPGLMNTWMRKKRRRA